MAFLAGREIFLVMATVIAPLDICFGRIPLGRVRYGMLRMAIGALRNRSGVGRIMRHKAMRIDFFPPPAT
jgi:hypothetical protein